MAVEVAVAEGILVERVVAEGMVVLKDCVALAQDAFDSTGVANADQTGWSHGTSPLRRAP